MLTIDKYQELLVVPGHITEDDFKGAVKEASLKNRQIHDILVEKGLIKDEQLGKLEAESLGYDFISLKNEKIEKDIVRLIPESVARFKGSVIISKNGNALRVGMVNPGDEGMKSFLQNKFGQEITYYFITKKDCENALTSYKGGLKESFDSIIKSGGEGKKLKDDEVDDTVVKIVGLFIERGYESRASDIHIEAHEEGSLLRFRIDGVMHDVLDIPKKFTEQINLRIKIMSKMRTDEHFAPQDGKIRFKTGDEKIDIRVSTMPSLWGEKIVLRILSEKNKGYDLADVGFSPDNLEIIKNAIRDPHGMILVTGPTGCGKTTTVYSILRMLNKREVNICTIEDPIEYDIDGITQTQVNEKAKVTFARGLRAIVRQDPDIIMVGEIRDSETANIAVNSALTGHLVLSTLHTNDAATTIPRLLDMGVEAFLAASTLNIAIAQRLVRKNCEKCLVSSKLEPDEIKIIESIPHLKIVLEDAGVKNLESHLFYKSKGCDVCNHTGFSGRVGIFEILKMEDNIKEMVVNRSASGKIAEQAKANGMKTMLYDGIKKAIGGTTTLIEVIRVAHD